MYIRVIYTVAVQRQIHRNWQDSVVKEMEKVKSRERERERERESEREKTKRDRQI